MSRLQRYESRTAGLLTSLAVVFLIVYGAPIVWPDLPTAVVRLCEVTNVAIWAAFGMDLCARVVMAEHRVRYLLKHPIDVLAVVLPMFRPLRVLRVFSAGQALMTRGSGLVRTGQAVVFSASVLILIGALAILDAERGAADANITHFGDAVWWALTTVTTVGYGDRYPVTALGRGVAAALMVVGISLLGVVTATVAAWFVNGGEEPAEAGTSTADRLTELEQLRREGFITDGEYAEARARMLDLLVR